MVVGYHTTTGPVPPLAVSLKVSVSWVVVDDGAVGAWASCSPVDIVEDDEVEGDVAQLLRRMSGVKVSLVGGAPYVVDAIGV